MGREAAARVVRCCALLDRRLTVLHAPDGFGKTALLAQVCRALRERGVAVAWLSLDEEDGPGSLASHLAPAFEQAGLATFGAADEGEEGHGAAAPDLQSMEAIRSAGASRASRLRDGVRLAGRCRPPAGAPSRRGAAAKAVRRRGRGRAALS